MERILKRVWQLSRHTDEKKLYEKVARELREIIAENENYTFQQKLSSLSAKKCDVNSQNSSRDLNKQYHHWKHSQEHGPKAIKRKQISSLNKSVLLPNTSTMRDFEQEVYLLFKFSHHRSMRLAKIGKTLLR
ncbi:unnamed protein product [Arctia plantaginis]|uniref:Uncharacterized protein n=1 Tax=Arctia plantaginis TaxID=874455 RepID=A0A8S0ZU67_ARCPL|nr:unnamed protein product [Arctia plantaginis]